MTKQVEELSRGEALARVAVLEAELAELRGRVCVPEGWTLDKPTVPGAYWVRGNGLPEALVVVKRDEGELWCNLHMSTTEQNFGYGFTVEQLDDSFEWLGPLAAAPVPVERVELMTWPQAVDRAARLIDEEQERLTAEGYFMDSDDCCNVLRESVDDQQPAPAPTAAQDVANQDGGMDD
ncbi:MAG: hypothetical protein VYD45_11430 [Pseudomonadota bacterium]|nr:hypothetical protein [Pseudomonadota bacterium]